MTEIRAKRLDLDEIFALPYDRAKKYIQKTMKAEHRLEVAEQIEDLLPDFYQGTKAYGQAIEGVPVMQPAHFERLMNKIKHYEQLLEWLYEVDMGWLEEILAADIQEALA